MTSTLPRVRTIAVAAVMALYATAASPQSAGTPAAHDHQDQVAAPSPGASTGMAGMSRDGMARIAALDTRIQTLAADMNMFVGDMKVETMAALLTAMVERQSLTGREMHRMHGGMMRMMERRSGATALPEDMPAAIDEEPGSLCAPTR